MKLNFWQWVGLIVLLAGLALLIWEKQTPKPSNGPVAPVTSPSAAPAPPASQP
jgi:hypothetical protein